MVGSPGGRISPALFQAASLSPLILTLEAASLRRKLTQGDTGEKPDVLVPLTTSLYVRGKLADPDRVIVDVGTGFFVEKVCFSRAPNLILSNCQYLWQLNLLSRMSKVQANSMTIR